MFLTALIGIDLVNYHLSDRVCLKRVDSLQKTIHCVTF